ncbi:O-methyltransferase [Nocardioides sp. AX2bis]|uniref:O-methyltransferase n=1 Tax=Nocardioides sp. AX2bis TaxID=2653157 RepID=UPI0012F091FF|nr:class I SAM-dependent methyltransferase [Nocardioides sp. AX2bis]VXB79731.1 SAM-dependent methyltransferase [Nocardioides sp. AX2bis]
MPDPRPVTPLGIAADLLERVERRLSGVDGIDDDVRADLARATSLVAGLDPYVAAVTSPASPALAALETRTRRADWGTRTEQAGLVLEQEMLSGHVEGRFLAFLVHATRARRVLEVGMFTGYSALAMAEAVGEGGDVVACELDPATAAFAQECFASSTAGERITVEVGPAADTLVRLSDAGELFDMVFIDADKPGYAAYLDAVLGTGPDDEGLLADGGVVCVDNTLLQGEPWAEGPGSANGRAVASFNERVAADPRVEQVLVPLRDGVTLLRRV